MFYKYKMRKKKIMFTAASSWYLHNFKKEHSRYLHDRFELGALVPNDSQRHLIEADFNKVVGFSVEPYGTNIFKELVSFCFFFFKLMRINPDLVLSFNPKTNLYTSMSCSILSKPFVLNISGMGSAENLTGLKRKVYNSLSSFFYRKAEHIFFQNPHDYHVQIERLRLDKNRCSVLPGSGVNFEKYQMARESLNHKDFFLRLSEKFVFLLVARLIKEKGIGEFVEAAARVKKDFPLAEFWIAGQEDSTERSYDLNANIERLGIKVNYLGVCTDMPKLYSTTHCVVLPSYYPEGTPRSLIEAAASGRPIITTEMPGCQDVVDEGRNGYKVPPRSVDSLENAMRKMLATSEDSYFSMCHVSIEKAKKEFSEEIIFREYDKIIERILGK